ncbi:Hpt domain-containing protein [Pseudoduganella buxea]|uniref:Phosphotransfer domain-containing protein n=1 Tax=Pseudoduganella buxea TaxID=1949069 RepID=A0A6I3SZV4_9BURK|nr:Hpt domain-containing protein [Pseudoduganella buxea]MTV53037.1 phosphotransfer domain-containing protein [Pseudoduganella buxea]GGC07958.1 hypothetical protein GCM10011572_31970 [Pseudoduganella buxea]
MTLHHQATDTLPVLDPERGLARLLGDRHVYGNVLRRFAGYASSIRDAVAQLASGDRDAAHRTIHTLRGAAGLVSAPQLAALAGQAEDALAAGQGIDELVGPLEAALQALLVEIARELERHPPPATAAQVPEQSDGAVLLQELARLLDEGNGAAVDLATRYGMVLAETLGAEPWQAVAAAIDEYDFDRALGLLRPAL